jgi:sRNA-binding regulator protein Hfq
MKKTLLILTLIVTSVISAFAQSDKIYKHSGELVEGNVVRVAEYTIIFKYANENAEQTISKYAVEKIVYGQSGRVENVTPKVLVVN